MARKKLMSYEGKPFYRWVKMFKGVRYRVKCSELPGVMVFTEEASLKAANEWWERKLVDLLGIPEREQTFVRSLVEDTERLQKELPRARLQAEIARRMVESARESGDVGAVLAKMPEVDLLATMKDVAPERTVKAAVSMFLAFAKRGKKGVPISPRSFADVKDFIGKMEAKLGVDNDIGILNPATVESMAVWIGSRWNAASAKVKRWAMFTRFVRYVYGLELIVTLPRNLEHHGFKNVTTKVKQYDIMEVRQALVKMKPRFRLYALLGLNCGMTNADIGNLTKDMVDMEAGNLTRRRVKTGDNENVPTVTYKLWEETLALLKECKADHPTLFLTSSDNTPLIKVAYAQGEPKIKDLIAQQWKRAKQPIPLKAFRSIGSTIIGSHEHYGRFTPHYLGHSPKSMQDKHYVAPSQELFDRIMTWLHGEVLGV